MTVGAHIILKGPLLCNYLLNSWHFSSFLLLLIFKKKFIPFDVLSKDLAVDLYWGTSVHALSTQTCFW